MGASVGPETQSGAEPPLVSRKTDPSHSEQGDLLVPVDRQVGGA